MATVIKDKIEILCKTIKADVLTSFKGSIYKYVQYLSLHNVSSKPPVHRSVIIRIDNPERAFKEKHGPAGKEYTDLVNVPDAQMETIHIFTDEGKMLRILMMTSYVDDFIVELREEDPLPEDYKRLGL